MPLLIIFKNICFSYLNFHKQDSVTSFRLYSHNACEPCFKAMCLLRIFYEYYTIQLNQQATSYFFG